MFLPMLLTWLIFMVFSMVPYHEEYKTNFFSCTYCGKPSLNLEIYLLLPTLMAVFLVQLFVIIFSYRTALRRKTWDAYSQWNIKRRQYIIVSSIFLILLTIAMCVHLHHNKSVFNPLLMSIKQCLCSSQIFHHVEKIRKLIEFMSLFAIVLLFSAVCTLVPTIVWDDEKRNWKYALEQLNHLIRWLKFYFLVAVVYLSIGTLFQFTYVHWLMSNLPDDKTIHPTAKGIIFLNSSFYVFLLFMLLVPVAIRLAIAASRIEGWETQGMTGSQRRAWRQEHGFPIIDVTSIVKYIVAILSPYFPILSWIWE